MSIDDKILMDKSYWVIPRRFRAGEYPGSSQEIETRKRLRWLLEQGIDTILDLTEENEAGLIPYHGYLQDEADKISCEVEYQRVPIKDFSTPPKDKVIEILDRIDVALEAGKTIYLHCYGGKGRTGMIVGCYLVRKGMSGKQALKTIHEFRKTISGNEQQSPETEGQIRMVMKWKKGQ